jgi:putative flippase GtrA
MPIFTTTYERISHVFHKLPLWVTRHKRYYKTCISGVISLCLQLMIFNALRLCIEPTSANTIAVEIAIITNFFINNHFTFYDRKQKKPGFKKILFQLGVFNLVSLSSMIIQYMSLHLELSLFGRHTLYENIALLMGIIIGSVVNFALYKTIVWKKW